MNIPLKLYKSRFKTAIELSATMNYMKWSLALVVFLFILFISPVSIMASDYYVSPSGLDSNTGSINSPWKTMKKAIESLGPGDTLYIRAGTYEAIEDAWKFQRSGTENQPITVKNYPGEQVIFKINSLRMEHRAFRCGSNTSPNGSANYIKLLGSDVNPTTLSNGVVSNKGLVVLGIEGANAIGVEGNIGGCHYWEIAGFDFIETGGGVFQRLGPSTHWYVHDNRVYNFYRESGMQFNGHYNVIENNQIYLVNSLPRTYGCQAINLVGHNNTVKNNFLTRAGSSHRCLGILFEWDFSDDNEISNNTIEDVPIGIGLSGGDRNQIINNTITATPNLSDSIAFNVNSYQNTTNWPCNEANSSLSPFIPPDDPNHPEYQTYYNPRNCHSHSNTIRNNKVVGFSQTLRQGPIVDSSNVFSDNDSDQNTTNNNSNQTKNFDLNHDGAVNIVDIGIIIDHYGKSSSSFEEADLDNNGIINIVDIGIIIDNYE